MTMKLYAPEYYLEFACIADKCKHSCCIGWEIDIDSDTLARYDLLSSGYGEKIRDSILRDSDGSAHFALGGDPLGAERCPHLDECGLCRIISELGEGYLCDICREHPRFYNYTKNRREVGLGMACEEACRLILTSDGYAKMLELADTGDADMCADPSEDGEDFDALSHRESIYSLLSNRSLGYSQRLDLLEEKYDVSPRDISDGEWRELLSSLEYLDDGHRALFAAYSSDVAVPVALEKMLERALAYFIYRHCTEACSEEDMRATVGFCLFMERLVASIAERSGVADGDVSAVVEIARAVSEEIEYSEENTDAIRSVFIY